MWNYLQNKVSILTQQPSGEVQRDEEKTDAPRRRRGRMSSLGESVREALKKHEEQPDAVTTSRRRKRTSNDQENDNDTQKKLKTEVIVTRTGNNDYR